MRDSWNVQWHYSYRHRGHHVAVAEECYSKCRMFGMKVSTAGTFVHEASQACHRASAARRQHAVAAESQAALLRAFWAYGELLKAVR